MSKRCFKCRELKYRWQFPKDCTRKDGLSGLCKACKSQKNKKYQSEHLDYFKEYGSQWRNKNPEYFKNYYINSLKQKS